MLHVDGMTSFVENEANDSGGMCHGEHPITLNEPINSPLGSHAVNVPNFPTPTTRQTDIASLSRSGFVRMIRNKILSSTMN